MGISECLDDPEPFPRFSPLGLRRGLLHFSAKSHRKLINLGILQHLSDGLGSLTGYEGIPMLLPCLSVFLLGEEFTPLQRGILWVNDDVSLEI